MTSMVCMYGIQQIILTRMVIFDSCSTFSFGVGDVQNSIQSSGLSGTSWLERAFK